MENVVHLNPVNTVNPVVASIKENKSCKTGTNFYPGAVASPKLCCKTETGFFPSPQSRLKTGFKESKLSKKEKKDDPYQLLDDYFTRLTTTGRDLF